MTDQLPPIVDEIPDEELGDVGPTHAYLCAEDGTVEEMVGLTVHQDPTPSGR